MAHTGTTELPSVVLATLGCPVEGCDQTIQVRGSLLIETVEGDEPDTAVFRLGSRVYSESIELHMVEHGLDPIAEEV